MQSHSQHMLWVKVPNANSWHFRLSTRILRCAPLDKGQCGYPMVGVIHLAIRYTHQDDHHEVHLYVWDAGIWFIWGFYFSDSIQGFYNYPGLMEQLPGPAVSHTDSLQECADTCVFDNTCIAFSYLFTTWFSCLIWLDTLSEIIDDKTSAEMTYIKCKYVDIKNFTQPKLL